MKIAFVGLRAIGCCPGGVERHVEELSTRLAGAGHEVTVFCRTRYNTLRSSNWKGVTLRNVPAVYSKHLEAISHTALTLPALLQGFDIVHFHATGPSLFSFVPRLAGAKVVVTVHGLDFKRAKWGGAAKLVLRAGSWTAAHFPHATIVVSKALQDYYLRAHGKETAYIPNAVTPKTYRPVDALSRFDLRGGDYLLFLGRLVPEKGAHHLIKAFRKVPTDLQLLIVGGGTHTDEYSQNLAQLAEGDRRIIFTGPLYGDEKEEALSNARAFVMPSELEGMPIVLLEAASYGLPILMSDIPECLEVFSGIPLTDAAKRPCCTFRSGDADDLALALTEILNQPDLPSMGDRGREHVLAHYAWDQVVNKVLSVYDSVL